MPAANPPLYLSRLRELARRRGGHLLSTEYRGDSSKLSFRCSEGHEWDQRPGAVYAGKWCPRCGHERTAASRRAKAESELRRTIARREGELLTPDYIDSHTKLRYRCRNGHEWEAAPGAILHGTWCPECARRSRSKSSLTREHPIRERLQLIARRHGGRALLETYRNYDTPLRFRCARGHEFEALPMSIDRGRWCALCPYESLMDRLQEKARSRGGRCLATDCRRGDEMLPWRCAVGHHFRARAASVLQGVWCRKCSHRGRATIEQMQRVARERGGECLSKRYERTEATLIWRCREGHVWRASSSSIVAGSWCPRCNRGFGRSRRRLSIEIMQAMAVERGGVCLSSKYEGIYSVLRWRCARGHEWATPANNVRRGGWCPRCAHLLHGTLDRIQAHAVGLGGRCMTRVWTNHAEPLTFECRSGHRFKLPANVLKSGLWCPDCHAATGRTRPRPRPIVKREPRTQPTPSQAVLRASRKRATSPLQSG